MPTTIADIIAARKAVVDILDHEIQDALGKKNAAANDAAAERFDKAIHQLMAQRVAIFQETAFLAMESDEMTDALNKLRDLTANMNTVAARMASVTGFFRNLADILDAASKVEDVLKRPGS